MPGETNLGKLLNTMQPKLNLGEYVFSTLSSADGVNRADILCEFKEHEGTTIIMARQKADALQLSYDYVAAWITLRVHSSLAATGLTAAVATALAQHNMSCNVVAGYYHDHLFIPHIDGEKAMQVLRELSEGNAIYQG